MVTNGKGPGLRAPAVREVTPHGRGLAAARQCRRELKAVDGGDGEHDQTWSERRRPSLTKLSAVMVARTSSTATLAPGVPSFAARCSAWGREIASNAIARSTAAIMWASGGLDAALTVFGNPLDGLLQCWYREVAIISSSFEPRAVASGSGAFFSAGPSDRKLSQATSAVAISGASQRSGRSRQRGMPVFCSTSTARLAEMSPSSHRKIVVLCTPKRIAS